MRPALVGLLGRKRSGKDSFAAGLISRGFVRVAFADPLKCAALLLDPIVFSGEACAGEPPVRLSEIVESVGWEKAKEYGEVRRTLQNYGVAVREIDPDFWTRAGMDAAHAARYTGKPVVVTDVRFPNEADAIEAAGGLLVRVTREGLAAGTSALDLHVSETALDDRETAYTVRNDGTLKDLDRAAASMVDALADA